MGSDQTVAGYFERVIISCLAEQSCWWRSTVTCSVLHVFQARAQCIAGNKQSRCSQGCSGHRGCGMVPAMGSRVGCEGSDYWSLQRCLPMRVCFWRACWQLFHSRHHGAILVQSYVPDVYTLKGYSVHCTCKCSCKKCPWHMQAHAPHMFMDIAQTDRQAWRRQAEVASSHNYVPIWAEKGAMGGVVWTAPGSRWGDADTLVGPWPPPTQGKHAKFLKWTVFVRDGFLVMRQDNRNDARYAPWFSTDTLQAFSVSTAKLAALSIMQGQR